MHPPRPTTPGTGSRSRRAARSPSAVSETEPRPHSARCASMPSSTPRAAGRRAARRRRTGRAATARPCPGGRRASRSAGRAAVVGRGSAGRPGASERSPSGVSSASRQASTTRRAVAVASGPSGSDDGEQLVRAHGRRRRRRAVDDVEEAARRRAARSARRTTRGAVRERGQRRRAPRRRPARRRRRARAIQSAFTSTGLPARGVTGHAVDARVHPRQRPALGALAQQPVGRVDADAVARARRRGAATICVEHRARARAPRSSSPVTATCRPTRVDEPERAVDRVVLERPRVGGVREHPLRDGRRRRAQHLAALVGAVRSRGRGPRTRSSGRATTRRTTDSRRRRSGARRS